MSVHTIPVLLGGPSAGQPVPDWREAVFVPVVEDDENGLPELTDSVTYMWRKMRGGLSDQAVSFMVPSDLELGEAMALAWGWLVAQAFPA